MSTEYRIYAEVKLKDKWFNLSPIVKTVDKKYLTTCLYWSQSYFYETYNSLEEMAISTGVPEDASEEILSLFHTPLEDKINGGWYPPEMTYREYYKNSVKVVDYVKAIVNRVRKDRPFQYMGYVEKRLISMFEVGEIDEIGLWYTEKEYAELDKEERQQCVWYEWNEPGDTYGILYTIYSRVESLLSWFADNAIPYASEYIGDDVLASNVRIIIEVC